MLTALSTLLAHPQRRQLQGATAVLGDPLISDHHHLGLLQDRVAQEPQQQQQQHTSRQGQQRNSRPIMHSMAQQTWLSTQVGRVRQE